MFDIHHWRNIGFKLFQQESKRNFIKKGWQLSCHVLQCISTYVQGGSSVATTFVVNLHYYRVFPHICNGYILNSQEPTFHFSLLLQSYIQLPFKHIKEDHHRSKSETIFRWWADGGPPMNAGWVGRHLAAALCSFIGRLQQSRYTATSQHMRQSKTQIRLRIHEAKVTSQHMRKSKTQIRQRIHAAKVTIWHIRLSMTQIRLRIRAAKVTSWNIRPSKTQIRLRIRA